MFQATYHPYQLQFKEPGGTSRGVLTSKMSYFIEITHAHKPGIKGIGECSVLPGLSPDDSPHLEEKLQWCCNNINTIAESFHKHLMDWPAIRFAVEMALLDLQNGGNRIWFPSDFTNSKKNIKINGLIWMGTIEEMHRRIKEKTESGFDCLKMKIGALDFDKEFELLSSIRERFAPDKLEIRVDANGAYTPKQAGSVLERLETLKIHSIEQPIKAGQWKEMAVLCKNTPVPIALDEELIGINNPKDRKQMLETIHPQFIILKPSLTGGFSSSENWIELAETYNIDWWVTSALESNIGLNAIAQWTATLNNPLPQGLGTGQVFTNNMDAPIKVEKGYLIYQKPNSGC
ncbi:o-succinylbenzoate synthase [Alkalitalea saponilacus]|uniref:o-succinylbenzoate synthase n=1 Tax=Alkalitalea saponilacus TaxID=889453 RepID=A0A1T5HSJ8_9BACT|nr:o-succinylbenzoate synthase [Alkalitalea saponilacus]ASB49999.1 o-succinylbenzoate synthase [Alkalitalea saponilacus]SKC23491.1 o-succinylbenzoate synthase [Alkalitalea saponilacus]